MSTQIVLLDEVADQHPEDIVSSRVTPTAL